MKRVEWVEVHIPDVDVLESYNYDGTPFPSTRYVGEVLGVVRSWGETKLVVLLDSGGVREVSANLVRNATQ